MLASVFLTSLNMHIKIHYNLYLLYKTGYFQRKFQLNFLDFRAGLDYNSARLNFMLPGKTLTGKSRFPVSFLYYREVK